MRYKGKVTKEFIEQRDRKVSADKNKNPEFRWDCEFVEHHQAAVDRAQTLYEGYEYDTLHRDLGRLDYKIYSKAGVHISEYIQKQVNKGIIDYFAIWSWAKPWEGPLEEGQVVEYDILGHVDAKEAIKHLNEENRFTFPL